MKRSVACGGVDSAVELVGWGRGTVVHSERDDLDAVAALVATRVVGERLAVILERMTADERQVVVSRAAARGIGLRAFTETDRELMAVAETGTTRLKVAGAILLSTPFRAAMWLRGRSTEMFEITSIGV